MIDIENKRIFWSEVAKENGWYKEPFYVQVWIKDNKIIDSVSFIGLDKDIIEEVEDEY